MAFSENLRKLLDFKDVPIKELSAKTKISKHTLDNYLSGQRSLPNAINALKIAKVLGVSVEYLVTGKRPQFRNKRKAKLVSEIANKMLMFNEKDLRAVAFVVDAILEKYEV